MRWRRLKQPLLWLMGSTLLMLAAHWALSPDTPISVDIDGATIVEPDFTAPYSVKAGGIECSGTVRVNKNGKGEYSAAISGIPSYSFGSMSVKVDLDEFTHHAETDSFQGSLRARYKTGYLFHYSEDWILHFEGDASGIDLSSPLEIDFEVSYFTRVANFIITDILLALVIYLSYWGIWFVGMLLRGRVSITFKDA